MMPFLGQMYKKNLTIDSRWMIGKPGGNSGAILLLTGPGARYTMAGATRILNTKYEKWLSPRSQGCDMMPLKTTCLARSQHST